MLKRDKDTDLFHNSCSGHSRPARTAKDTKRLRQHIKRYPKTSINSYTKLLGISNMHELSVGSVKIYVYNWDSLWVPKIRNCILHEGFAVT